MAEVMECCKDGHDFIRTDGCVHGGYYKEKNPGVSGMYGLKVMDQTVSYGTVVCRRCGDSKEIIVQDHRAVAAK